MTGFGHFKRNEPCKDDVALLMKECLTFQQLSHRRTLSLLTNALSFNLYVNTPQFVFQITCHRIIYSFFSGVEG